MPKIGLTWNRLEGRGFVAVNSCEYGQDYFDKYLRYEREGFALKLNRKRADLVDKYIGDAPVIDVGVGCGTFIKVRRNTLGYDVGKPSLAWLNANDLWFDVWKDKCLHATFWDSLEHICHLEKLLANIQHFVFMSMPIFSDYESAISSRHFRPDEHWHYFTAWGFVKFMQEQGFQLLEYNLMEQEFGREDIGTFVFKRIP